jgi:hypothetical protein
VQDPSDCTDAQGNDFQTWSFPGTMYAQVRLPMRRGYRPWGPIFEYRPAFAKIPHVLLGRDDFFRTFVVTFRRADQLIELECP